VVAHNVRRDEAWPRRARRSLAYRKERRGAGARERVRRGSMDPIQLGRWVWVRKGGGKKGGLNGERGGEGRGGRRKRRCGRGKTGLS
jgi:hypothetical protein